jgi:hypothetical protein
VLLTPHDSAILTLSGLLAWITGHQASHCAALLTGRAEYFALAGVMALEPWAFTFFLIWYAYMQGIRAAIWLVIFSFIFQICLVGLERSFGLTKRAWIISLVGIPLVPVIIATLVWLVLFPISE